MSEASLFGLFREEVRSHTGVLSAGLVGLEAMPASAYRALGAGLPAANLHDADDLVMQLRMEKSDAEIAMLRYSAKVGAAITRAMMEQVEPGNTDGDLAAAALSIGARIPGVAQWDIPLASGSCSGHFQYARLPSWDAATPYAIGDIVHPDNYGYANGYIYDIVRTRVAGDHPADWQTEIIDGAAGCVRAVIGAMRVGITAGELFDVGKAYLIENGFTDEVAFNTSFPCFGHQDGHAFDDPWLARNTPDEGVQVPRTRVPLACVPKRLKHDTIRAAKIQYVRGCLQRKLLTNNTHGNVLRLLPALTLTDAELDAGCDILDEVLLSTKA